MSSLSINQSPPLSESSAELFDTVISSDRLKKDVENLMNSSFWIDALKKSRAFGIGSNLYCKNLMQNSIPNQQYDFLIMIFFIIFTNIF